MNVIKKVFFELSFNLERTWESFLPYTGNAVEDIYTIYW